MQDCGLFGFRTKNYEKLILSFDNPSPSALGVYFVRALYSHLCLHGNKISSLRDLADRVPVVDSHLPPGFSNNSNIQLMEYMLAPPSALLAPPSAHRPLYDGHNYLAQGMWCHWVYVMNLETRKLEIHRGGNKDPKAPGRYAATVTEPSSDYCGPRLVLEIPVKRISKELYVSMIIKRLISLHYDTDKGKHLLSAAMKPMGPKGKAILEF